MFRNKRTRVALIVGLVCLVLAFAAWFVPEPLWIRAHGVQRIDITLGAPPYYCATITNAEHIVSVVGHKDRRSGNVVQGLVWNGKCYAVWAEGDVNHES